MPVLTKGPDVRLKVDLLWKLLGNSKQADKENTYFTELLGWDYNYGSKRDQHPFNQLRPAFSGRHGEMACGSAVKDFCERTLNGLYVVYSASKEKWLAPYMAYYKKPVPLSGLLPLLKFDGVRAKEGIRRMCAALDKDKAVRLPLAYHNLRGNRQYIPAHHYIGVVGYGSGRFLYIDPWPEYSRTTYAGMPVAFMGFLVFDAGLGTLRIDTTWTSTMNPQSRVLGGP